MDSKPTKSASDSLPATFFHMDFKVFFKTTLGSMFLRHSQVKFSRVVLGIRQKIAIKVPRPK